MKMRLLLAVVGVTVLVLPAQAAAQGNPNPTSTQSSAQSGVCLDPAVIEPATIEVACSESTSDGEGTDAEGSPAQILVVPINESQCPRTLDEIPGQPTGGSRENAGFGDVLLGSSCENRRTPGAVSSGNAEAFILDASSDQGSLTVGESSANTGFDSRRNSAVAAAEATFTLVRAEGGGQSVEILFCRSTTQDNPGGEPQTTTEGRLIRAGGQGSQLDPVAGELCTRLLVSTEAESGR